MDKNDSVKTIRRLLAFFVICISGLFTALSTQAQIMIPLNTFQKPPVDLLDQKASVVDDSGQHISFGDLAKYFLAGVDISKFSPIENKIWQNGGYFQSALDIESEHVRAEILANGGVNYDADYGGNREIGLYSIAVRDAGNISNKFTLTLGTNVHTSLLRSALLRKLGFYQLTPTLFPKLRIRFKDKAEKQTFIDNAFCIEKDEDKPDSGEQQNISISCLPIIPSLAVKNPRKEPFFITISDTELELRSVYLERMNSSIPSLVDGLTPANQFNVLNYGAHRGFRALVVPFAIAELGESINRTESEAAKLDDGYAAIKLAFASDFSTSDHFDVQWMLRRMALLTSDDWMAIVRAAQYPNQCLNKMAYNNLIFRFKSMVSTFNYKQKPTIYSEETGEYIEVDHQHSPEGVEISDDVLSKVKVNYNCNEDGQDVVLGGRLVIDYFKDSPIRFKHDLVPSPWQGSQDILRWAIIKIQTGMLNVGLSLLIKKLEKKSQSFGETTITIRQGQPPEVLGSMSERRIKADIHGARTITTGVLLGSRAPVQMVDTLTLSVGGSNTLLKILAPDILRGIEGKIFANRQFLYVKPIGSMVEARKIKIKEILKIPQKLKQLAVPLMKGDVMAFLRAMQVDEVFSITDTIGSSLTAALNLGFDPTSFLGLKVTPTLTIGINQSNTVTGQTVVIRNESGYQIIIRRLDLRLNRMVSRSFFLDITAVVTWLHLEKSKTTDIYSSEYYSFNYDADFMGRICPKIFSSMPEYQGSEEFSAPCAKGKFNIEEEEDDTRRAEFTAKAHGLKRLEKTAITALAPLFYRGDTRALDADPVMQKRRFDIKNTVNTKGSEVHFMHYKNIKFAENQLVELRDPILKDGTLNKDQKIKVAVSTRAELIGDDIVGFSLGAIDFFLKEKLGDLTLLLAELVENPANMPKGHAEWHVTETQSEVTSIGSPEGTKMPPMATIRRYFGGWSLEQDEVNDLVKRINLLLPPELFGHVQFIPDGLLDRAGKIDFYRFILSLKIEKDGLDNLKRLLFAEGNVPAGATRADERNFIKRMLTRLNEKITGHYRPKDNELFNDIVELYGSDHYSAECKNESNQIVGEATAPTRVGITFAGTTYPCLAQWLERLIVASRKFDESDTVKATESITEVLEILNQQIPIASLLKVIGTGNYRYTTNVIGFRAKDENAMDSNWKGPVFGEPQYLDVYPDSLLGELSRRYNLIPFVLNKTRVPI